VNLQNAIRAVAKRNPTSIKQALLWLAAELDDQEEGDGEAEDAAFNAAMEDRIYGSDG
jgi:hypothetical protein